MGKGKVKKRIMLVALGAVTLGFLVYGTYRLALDPYRGSVKEPEASLDLDGVMRNTEALADLDHIRDRILERHPAAMDGLPPHLMTAYEEERQGLLEKEEVTVTELWQSASRFLQSLGDAHTKVVHNRGSELILPLTFRFQDDGLYASGLGLSDERVQAISGRSVPELYEDFRKHYSHELEGYLRHMFATHIRQQSYHTLLDLSVDTPMITLAGGEEIETFWQESPMEGEDLPGTDQPETDQSGSDFVRYEIDEKLSLGTFYLDRCQLDEEYLETLHNFFRAVKKQGIRQIAVDLRENPGGTTEVVREFLRYIDVQEIAHGGTQVRFGPILINNKAFLEKNPVHEELAFKGPIYVMTSAYSFSAAVDFAVTLSDNGLAKIIGRTPGNMPSSYGDIVIFQTPHARLLYSVSYKYFKRWDESKNDLPLIPDHDVPAEDALDAVKELITTAKP